MRQIGQYQILEELGRGAMGVVYRAVDSAIDRPLAIKIIRTHEFDSAEDVTEAGARLTREASAVGRLSHPNIVVLYQFGQEPDFDYIAMEFVPGSSLDKLLKSGHRFTTTEVLDIVRQVAAALDHAHANGVVHRDIKPANIIARPDGVVKVTDFGIARISSQTITRDGASMGTPAYMAPEQIRGEKADARADQFSLAIVAYQLFSGTLPYKADSDMSLMLRIMNNEPEPLREPKEADRIIRRALSKDPAQRFASCGEFAKALQAAFPKEHIFDPEATTRSLPPVPAALAKKKHYGLIAFAAVALIGAALAAFFLTRMSPAPETAPVPVPRRSAPVARTRPAAPPTVDTGHQPVINPVDRQTYVWIPPGTFMMGCNQGEPGCDNYPPVEKTIDHGFWLGQTEVTQAAWRRVMQTTPGRYKGDRFPVESVSVSEADDYCRTVKGRLPTEVEWEYAARAGNPAAQDGWNRKNSHNSPQPVATSAPNPWGLYDMLGNVWEWTAGLPGSAEIRGGSYSNEPRYAKVYSRRPGTNIKTAVGFRCAADQLP